MIAFEESAFDEGLGFDGSSIRGWQGIAESDLLLMPQAETAVIDPFCETPTLSLLCEIAEPGTLEGYSRDPRRIAKKAEEHLRSTCIADTAYMGPECEFFVFDSVWYELGDNRAHHEVDSAEGQWNSGKPGLGYTVRPVNLVYSQRNRSACIRIPMYSEAPKATRIEFRCPDASANPYLASAAMLMAGIDGIEQGLDPGEPADWDLFHEDRGAAQVPGSLGEALDARLLGPSVAAYVTVPSGHVSALSPDMAEEDTP